MSQISELENLCGPNKPLSREAPDATEIEGPEVWRVLSKCHDLRNRAEYGGEFGANNGLLRDLIDATERVLNALKN